MRERIADRLGELIRNSSGRLERVLRAQYVRDALDGLISRPAIVWWLRKLKLREKKKRGPR